MSKIQVRVDVCGNWPQPEGVLTLEFEPDKRDKNDLGPDFLLDISQTDLKRMMVAAIKEYLSPTKLPVAPAPTPSALSGA